MTKKPYGYKDFTVWQRSVELVKIAYAVIKTFPAEERYALSDQMRRAVVSISSNIAEGNGRTTPADYAHFLSMARGSLYEVETQLHIDKELGYITDLELFSQADAVAKEIRKMLNSFMKKLGAFND